MIRNFGDHAANERTFLAWVRTAIAVMAFGFIVEKFDLFLATAPQLADQHIVRGSRLFGDIAGFALILMGTGMIAIATARFLSTAKAIDSPETKPETGARLDEALAVLLVLLGISLLFYLSQAIVARL